ncbi:MAG: hypothetical protein SGJ00_04870 [bacterium]|nr:hypothetical protein [bacterium]
MKTINLFILNILLIGGLTFSTCNKARAMETPQMLKIKAISTEIKHKISFPEALIGKEIHEKVVIEFKLKEDKSIELVNIETNNEVLKLHISKELEQIRLKNTEGFEGKILQVSVYFENLID